MYRNGAKCRRCGRRVGSRNLTGGLCNACRRELDLPVPVRKLYIQRSVLHKLKDRMGMSDRTDEEFAEWIGRSNGVVVYILPE